METIASIFQTVYIFSVVTMCFAAYSKLQESQKPDSRLKTLGAFYGSFIAAAAYFIVIIGDFQDTMHTCPISFFVYSVYYNIAEYRHINFKIIKDHASIFGEPFKRPNKHI